MASRDSLRKLAREIAMSFLGKWYKWGGDDPAGFDCSGFVLEILKSVGLFPRRGDTTALGIFKRFHTYRVKKPSLGVLVFYGSNPKDPETIQHVEFCLDDFVAIGASGGNRRTETVRDAIRMNAFIKIRPIERNRPIIAFVDPFRSVGK